MGGSLSSCLKVLILLCVRKSTLGRKSSTEGTYPTYLRLFPGKGVEVEGAWMAWLRLVPRFHY